MCYVNACRSENLLHDNMKRKIKFAKFYKVYFLSQRSGCSAGYNVNCISTQLEAIMLSILYNTTSINNTSPDHN